MEHNLPIEQACKLTGGVSALARLLGVKPPTVHEWITGVRPVPMDRCIEVEIVTGGRVRCDEIRPDKKKLFDYLRTTDPRFRSRPSVPQEGAGAPESSPGGMTLEGVA